MTSHDFLEWVPAGSVALCVWFLHQTLADFKSFKSKCEKEFHEIAKIKNDALSSISGFSIEMSRKVDTLKDLHRDYDKKVSDSLRDINNQVERFSERAEVAEQFFHKALDLAQELNRRVNKHQEQIKTIQVKLGENAVMYKSKKP